MLDTKKIVFKEIRVSQLIQFAQEVKEWVSMGSGMLPITPWRAMAHVQNPAADSNDIALIVAIYESQVIGYLGNMPGILRKPDGDHKVNFLSTFLTSSKARRTGLGWRIITKMFENDFDFVLTGVSGSAEGLYRKLELPKIGSYYAYVANIGEHNIVFRLFRKLAHVTKIPSLKLLLTRQARRAMWLSITPGLYSNLEERIEVKIKKLFGKKQCYRSSSLSNAAISMIDRRKHINTFFKDGAAMSWILSYPWAIKRDQTDASEVSEYSFSSVFDQYEYVVYEIYDGNNLDSLAVFLFQSEGNEGNLKLIDFEMPANVAAKLSAIEAARLRASRLILPGPIYIHLKDQRHFSNHEVVRRDYYARPAIQSELVGDGCSEIIFQPSDGDQFVVTSS